ncbi:MAG: SDR family oxidoreductase [Verrucomicrobiales bacterium]|nr:SDR family oxidoreductase [Verrucomicrobiales bacterium]
MRVLVTGNMGYIGPVVVRHLRSVWPDAELIGFDMGYFAQCLTSARSFPEALLNEQHFGDVRRFPPKLLRGVDAVVHLAAISNDPMGNAFEQITFEINHRASVELARQAKAAHVKSFVFASSCSVYGYAEEGARNEASPLDPLTAYAKSKVLTEQDLGVLAGSGFTVTCLRFATACGMSERLRLDLVLNDFVASAVAANKITILSDGSPWRPLIHVSDMARTIEWAIQRDPSAGVELLVVNAGADQWNYQVKVLAEAVGHAFPGVEIAINEFAQPDKRSYRVDFARFRSLAPKHQPRVDLMTAISGLRTGLEQMNFHDQDFRKSQLMRLNTLSMLRKADLLSDNLEWTAHSGAPDVQASDTP